MLVFVLAIKYLILPLRHTEKMRHSTDYEFRVTTLNPVDFCITVNAHNCVIWSPDERTVCLNVDANGEVSKITIYHPSGQEAHVMERPSIGDGFDGSVTVSRQYKAFYDEYGHVLHPDTFMKLYRGYVYRALLCMGITDLQTLSYLVEF
jgi:hypothetical protein